MAPRKIGSEKQYFLGVDVGGTKSHALIATETGVPVGFGKAGSGHWEIVTYDGLRIALETCIHGALTEANIRMEEITSVGLGISGYDWPSQKIKITEIVKAIGITQPFEITNDTIIGLLAGSENGWGIAVVAGSGCNCRGWDENKIEGRVISGDEWAGEGGGGSFLVLNAIRAVAREFTQRGDTTKLTQLFLAAKQVRSSAELLEGFALNQIIIDANDAPLVFEAEKQGDPIAIEIVEQSGMLLGDLACGVIRQLNFQERAFEVVMVGSLYKGSNRLQNMMKKTIVKVAPGAKLVRLDLPPVIGGLLLAFEQVDIPIIKLRKELIENCQVFFG